MHKKAKHISAPQYESVASRQEEDSLPLHSRKNPRFFSRCFPVLLSLDWMFFVPGTQSKGMLMKTVVESGDDGDDEDVVTEV